MSIRRLDNKARLHRSPSARPTTPIKKQAQQTTVKKQQGQPQQDQHKLHQSRQASEAMRTQRQERATQGKLPSFNTRNATFGMSAKLNAMLDRGQTNHSTSSGTTQHTSNTPQPLQHHTPTSTTPTQTTSNAQPYSHTGPVGVVSHSPGQEAQVEASASESGGGPSVTGNRNKIVEFGSESDNINISQSSAGDIVVSDGTNTETFAPADFDNLKIRGGGGDDTITIDDSVSAANSKKITLSGGSGDDTINGNDKDNLIFGGSGEDTINAGAGKDDIYGGRGNDTINGGAGNDKIRGEDGADTLNAGAGNDEVYGNAGNDTINAGAGNDEVEGGTGNDTIRGGTGNDKLNGQEGNDTIEGGTGHDNLSGQSGTDTLLGGRGDDLLAGGQGNDTLNGNAGADTLIGGAGHDSIEATHDGKDIVSGGPGGDHVRIDSNDVLGDPEGVDMSTDANGNPVLRLDGSDNEVTVSQNGNQLEVNVDGRTITFNEETSKNLTIDGGAGNDRITLDESVTLDVRIEGGAGNDTLVGNSKNNTLIGNEGDDNIRGGDGDDYIEGGAGNDRLYGGTGKDTIYGLDGDDKIYGGSDQDYIDGGRGADEAFGGAGNDVLFGGRGADTLNGGVGDDVIAGGHGTDHVDAGKGHDRIYAQADDTHAQVQDTQTIRNVELDNTDNIGSSIQITGDADFQARVQSDLDALRSTPTGRQMLEALDKSGHTVTINPTTGGFNTGNTASVIDPENTDHHELNSDGSANVGRDGNVNYNPSRDRISSKEWGTRPPIIGLFHELSHAYNYVTGTLPDGSSSYDVGGTTHTDTNKELAAMGLDYDLANSNEYLQNQPSENQLRDELGLPHRPYY